MAKQRGGRESFCSRCYSVHKHWNHFNDFFRVSASKTCPLCWKWKWFSSFILGTKMFFSQCPKPQTFSFPHILLLHNCPSKYTFSVSTCQLKGKYLHASLFRWLTGKQSRGQCLFLETPGCNASKSVQLWPRASAFWGVAWACGIFPCSSDVIGWRPHMGNHFPGQPSWVCLSQCLIRSSAWQLVLQGWGHTVSLFYISILTHLKWRF